jgi:hypothetical protein
MFLAFSFGCLYRFQISKQMKTTTWSIYPNGDARCLLIMHVVVIILKAKWY